jgi:tetratricopeptide (TPR) repeat protein
LPLILFLWCRGQALAQPLAVASTAGDADGGTFDLLTSASLPGWRTVLDTAGVMGLSLKLMIWPDPLLVFRAQLPRVWEWAALLLHGALIALAIVNYRRKRYGLVLGLVFFYVAYLPSSRLFGLGPGTPHAAERYLYFPSVGPTILLAFALRSLSLRIGFRTTLAAVVLALALLTPLTWARNAQWSSEIRLFEADLANGGRDAQLVRVLTGAYLEQGNDARVVDICDRHPPRSSGDERYANHCGIGYGQVGMTEKAIQAYSNAIGNEKVRATAHANLARLYLSQNRRSKAAEHLQLAVEAERDPARRAYRKGIMMVRLYPSDRARLLEAREHFAEAVRLQPQMAPARQWLQRIDEFLARQ